MSKHLVALSSSEKWAKVMDQVAKPSLEWKPEELASIWKHQLAAPLESEIESVRLELEADLARRVAARMRGKSLNTFGELLQHFHPPIALLHKVKDFAKANRDHPESLLPPDISTVLYYGSIVAALVHCGQRISRLDDPTLRHGIEWALAQSWVDDRTRSLLAEGLDVLRSTS